MQTWISKIGKLVFKWTCSSASVNTLRATRAASSTVWNCQGSAEHQTAFSVKGVLELAT